MSEENDPQRPLHVRDQEEQGNVGLNHNQHARFEGQADHDSPSSPENNLEGQISPQASEELNPEKCELVPPGAPLLTKGGPKSHREGLGSHDSLPPPPPNSINRAAKEGYVNLRKKFAKITVDIYRYLDSKEISLSPFRVYLTTGFGLKLRSENQRLTEISNWEEMMRELSQNQGLDFLNSQLLNDLVDECFEDENEKCNFEKRLKEHSTEVEKYKRETLVVDYLDVHSTIVKDEGVRLLKAKFTGDMKRMTLAKLSELCVNIASEFSIDPTQLKFITANPGCIIIFWQVPESICSHIKEVCEKLQPDFGQAGIIELTLNDHVLYQAQNIHDIVKDESLIPISDVMANYDKLYEESIKNPKKFWFKMASKMLIWNEPCTAEKVMEGCDMQNGKIHFFDGKLNASVNCLDRHAKATPNKTAIIWEKNDGTSEKISYYELLKIICQIAHVLTNKGVVKGDVIIIYMSSSPMAVAAMLACTRIGAIHSVAFADLKVNELKDRIEDAKAKYIITSNVAKIGEKELPLKANIDNALLLIESEPGCNKKEPAIQKPSSEGYVTSDEHLSTEEERPKPHFTVLVSNRYPSAEYSRVPWNENYDFDLEKEMEKCPTTFDPVPVEAEDIMFIMYTSGTTSGCIPTGIKHSTAGYLLYAALTHKYIFDYKPGDVFGCTAVLGWITGHSYVVYGPLCNGATTMLFEGIPTFPNNDRYWKAIQDHKINQLYVNPQEIRQLKRDTDDASKIKKGFDLTSLKTIATVGEPLNSDVCSWLRGNIGCKQCKFVDTWWQTETGGIAIIIDHGLTALPSGNFPAKPFLGVDPVIYDPCDREEKVGKTASPGYLCLKQPLPGMARDVTGMRKKKFREIYFNFKEYGKGFFTSDLALRLEKGGYRITGRLNGAMRVQGQWLDVAHIEDELIKSDARIVEISVAGHRNETAQLAILQDKFDYETTCIFVELKSVVNKKEQKDIRSILTEKYKKMICMKDTIVKIPGTIPPILVVMVFGWSRTHSGKVVLSVHRSLIEAFEKIWRHEPTELPFDEFCTVKHYNMHHGPLSIMVH